MFYPFYADGSVRLIGVEAAGESILSGRHAATLSAGSIGVFHGAKCYLLQEPDGQVTPAHSISAGLDYPGVGPEHSYYKATGRAEYVSITDEEAVEGFKVLSELEGIIPALEAAHAIAYVRKLAPTMAREQIIVICLSGRGDKDVYTIYNHSKEVVNHA
jgi:tryptophan synthase beta chain